VLPMPQHRYPGLHHQTCQLGSRGCISRVIAGDGE